LHIMVNLSNKPTHMTFRRRVAGLNGIRVELDVKCNDDVHEENLAIIQRRPASVDLIPCDNALDGRLVESNCLADSRDARAQLFRDAFESLKVSDHRVVVAPNCLRGEGAWVGRAAQIGLEGEL
jgi:hypothetical protein